jgi:hypothetical protein
MSKWCFVAVPVVLLWGASAGATAGDEKKVITITKFGEHSVFDGKLVVKVSEDDGKLTLAMQFAAKPDVRYSTSLVREKGAFWVVYPESPKRVWMLQGKTMVEFELTDGGSSTTAISAPDVLKRAPKALLDALPKEVLEGLKGDPSKH